MDRDTPKYHGRDLAIFATQHPKRAISATSTSDLGTEYWTEFSDFTQNYLAQQTPSPIAVNYLQSAQPGYGYLSLPQQYLYGTSNKSQGSPGSQVCSLPSIDFFNS